MQNTKTLATLRERERERERELHLIEDNKIKRNKYTVSMLYLCNFSCAKII